MVFMMHTLVILPWGSYISTISLFYLELCQSTCLFICLTKVARQAFYYSINVENPTLGPDKLWHFWWGPSNCDYPCTDAVVHVIKLQCYMYVAILLKLAVLLLYLIIWELVFWELVFWELDILGVGILGNWYSGSWYFGSWYNGSWYSGTNSSIHPLKLSTHTS